MSDKIRGGIVAEVSKVVFLDRDGTINDDTGYLNDPNGLVLIDGVVDAVRLLKSNGFKVVVITNQSGIARGIIQSDVLTKIHRKLMALMEKKGAGLDGIYYCPHMPGSGCSCRKPMTGLIDKAVKDIGLDPNRSYVVGDKFSDIEMARKSGSKGVLVLTGYGRETFGELKNKTFGPDFIAEDLLAAAKWIVEDV